jgi:ribose-phosphate pyrophosphokinase
LKSVILALPGNEQLAAGLAATLQTEVGRMTVRRFPDGESYVRIETPVDGRNVVLACGLHDPDTKILALLFAASTARELGANQVGLVAPYLAYMRQDKRFNEGESITSIHFAKLISHYVDWLVTVDPHLHRRTSLDDIYSVPSIVAHAAPLLAQWIRANVDSPVLVGPDSESEQWVSEVARGADAPWQVLEKIRRGDRDVSVSIPDPGALRGRTPVLVDDIISTARTMMAAIRHLAGLGLAKPVCVGVHAVFAGTAYADLAAAGVARIVTCNTIAHESNAIDVSGPLAEAMRNLLAMRPAVPASGSAP